MKSLKMCAFVAMAALLSGCTSRWQESFVSTGAQAPALVAGAPVVVREIPWERMNATLTELQEARSKSDVHPDDWTEAQKEQERTKLLRGLQVQGDADVLGRSQFKSTAHGAVKPDDGELMNFARSIGANRVVTASMYVGKTEVVKQETAQVERWRESWYKDDAGKWRSRPYLDRSTVWVPVVVSADEYALVAFFLRDR